MIKVSQNKILDKAYIPNQISMMNDKQIRLNHHLA